MGPESNSQRLQQWMKKALPCVAGARAFKAGRYLIQSIASAADMQRAFTRFTTALQQRETVAGLFVLCDRVSLPRTATGTAQMAQLARMMQQISSVPPDALARGGKLNMSLCLRCPVTGQDTLFDDFDAVAFCPQSADIEDALYDPMMAAPVPCVNINSDIYAFGMFVRDLSLKRCGQEVYALSLDDRTRVFEQAVALWQRYAERTIKGYVAQTDIARCPMGLIDNNTRWVAPHQDPAFAETVKTPHVHDMPVLYAPRIVSLWHRRLAGEDAQSRFHDITPYGTRRPGPV